MKKSIMRITVGFAVIAALVCAGCTYDGGDNGGENTSSSNPNNPDDIKMPSIDTTKTTPPYTDPCAYGPTEECCTYYNPDYPGCQPITPQVYCRYGSATECYSIPNEYMTRNDCNADGGFVVAYCSSAPSQAECAAYNNAASGCANPDPCASNPTPNCPNYCQVYPNAGHCKPTPITYTLTVTSEPTEGGTTNPAGSLSNIPSGTPFNIYATPASGYIFDNWMIASGGATITNANNESATVTLTSDATIIANFQQYEYYCRWLDGCVGIDNPTDLEYCRYNSFVSEYSDCRDAPQIVYCRWEEDCYPLLNADGASWENPGLTYLENCVRYSKPKKVFESRAACLDWEPPVVRQFCNYGRCVDGSGWECTGGGGCWHLQIGVDCATDGGTLVDSCPAGTKPPSANW